MTWIYNKKTLSETDIPEEAIGFIYKIIHQPTNKFYIGKKVLNFTRKKRLTKKEKELSENKRKTFKRVTTDSNWKNYWGSCKELNEDVKNLGEEQFVREIIEFCFDKRQLSYKEVWYQFNLNVLEVNSYNGNILSRFFRPKTN